MKPIWERGEGLFLEARGISVFYNSVRAIEDVSFRVDSGEIVAMVGPNGAGKSTALKAVFGLVKLQAGDILFQGESMKGLRPDEPSVGFSPDYVDTIFEKMVEISKSGTSILLVEQNARMALEIAHRGYVFKIGAIFLESAGKELLEKEDVKKVLWGD
ncbi:MAG TPA: ATP-binding cassette domain-containing protein [Candidatus Brocadia sapporoensis]|nr:ATP-binding cassette domain-containing protein [Candidatus Brocadia sp.]HQU32439.1 ATP-binding cassette domain-containing protein [Candidatus Brocadia sapporoensis]